MKIALTTTRPTMSGLHRSLRLVLVLMGFLLGTTVETNSLIAAEPQAWGQQYIDSVRPIVVQKCVSCHGAEEPDGGIDLSGFNNVDDILKQNDLWNIVAKRIRLNEMPPQGSPGLTDPEKSQFMRWIDSSPKQNLCNQLASDETQSWYRGYVMSRRLTQTEYNYILRDLMGVDLQPGKDLPADGSGGEGFDTSGVTLFTSPIHLEKYLAAADQVVEAILVDDPNQVSPEIQQARRKWLIAQPSETVSPKEAARQILVPFVNEAYRRPVAAEEIDRLTGLFEITFTDTQNFLASVRQTFKAVLMSPHFLFVSETEHEGGIQRLTPHQFATRLSLLIWSSQPDTELRQLADAGTIYDEAILKSQITRMLKDPKARALGENFTMQWLGLNRVGTSVRPDQQAFPEFTDALAHSMREEVIRTSADLFQNNRSLLELIDAPEVLVDPALAKLYQIEEPVSDWQRVPVGNSQRGGVITSAAMLTSTSYPLRTSPVLRGTWILENILGERVPPPPPNVPALEEVATEQVHLTFRERLELHRKDPQCGSCHNRIDPLGFSLERFDVLGRYRETESDQPIDDRGKLSSGREFQGGTGLKQVLLSRKKDVMRHLTKKMLGYALGRELNKFDQCVIDETMKALEQNNYQAQVLIEQIAFSYPFQHRYFKKAE